MDSNRGLLEKEGTALPTEPPQPILLSWFVEGSVTRFDNFWKLLVTKYLAKVAQIISNFKGYFEKPHSFVKTNVATSWVTFGNIWATYYSNIWSHCVCRRQSWKF